MVLLNMPTDAFNLAQYPMESPLKLYSNSKNAVNSRNWTAKMVKHRLSGDVTSAAESRIFGRARISAMGAVTTMLLAVTVLGFI